MLNVLDMVGEFGTEIIKDSLKTQRDRNEVKKKIIEVAKQYFAEARIYGLVEGVDYQVLEKYLRTDLYDDIKAVIVNINQDARKIAKQQCLRKAQSFSGVVNEDGKAFVSRFIESTMEILFTSLQEQMDDDLKVAANVIIDTLEPKFEKINSSISKIEKQVKQTVQDVLPEVSHKLTNPPIKRMLLYRDELLTTLEKRLEQSDAIVITGFGGIGKTSMMRSLYHRVKDKYKHVAWIEYQNNLEQSLITSLKIYGDIQDVKVRYQKIEMFLRTAKDDTLFFIDDIPQEAEKDINFLQGIDAKVVLTSRMVEMDGYELFEVPFLSEDECIDVFYDYYKYDKTREHELVVRSLVRLASCHTLTVELLAKAANYKNVFLEEYYQKLLVEGFGYPEKEFKTIHTQDSGNVARHLTKLFNLLDLDRWLKKILKNFAVLPNIELPSDINKWIGCDINSINELVVTGWIQESEQGFYMSPIVKEAIALQENIHVYDCSGLIFQMGSEDFFDVMNGYKVNQIRIDMTEAFLKKFGEEKEVVLGKIFANIATALSERRDNQKALFYYEKSLAIVIEKLGTEDINVATLYNNIANIYASWEQYEKAFDYYDKALTIKKRIWGETHPQLAVIYNNIGTHYYNLEEYPQALIYFKKAFEMEHPDLSTVYLNMAGAYVALGNYQKQLIYLEKAFEAGVSRWGPEHLEMAAIYDEMAMEHRINADYDGARLNHEKSVQIYERVWGNEHPSLVDIYNMVADTFLGFEDYEMALFYFRKSLNIVEKIPGVEHQDTLPYYNTIFSLYDELEEKENAYLYAEKAFGITEEKRKERPLEVAASYQAIGCEYHDNGDYQSALFYYQKCVELTTTVQDEYHHSLETVYNDMAEIYDEQEEYDLGEQYYEKAYEIVRRNDV